MTNQEKIQELLNEPCWESNPYLVGMNKVGVEDVMERPAEWKDENLNFISVKDRLPELRECVLVFGVLDASIPIFNSDGERIYHPDKVFDVWFNKRTEPSEHTDGNGFLLLKFHEEYKITHWFPLPKLDGKELYERI